MTRIPTMRLPGDCPFQASSKKDVIAPEEKKSQQAEQAQRPVSASGPLKASFGK
jgi:hypothetical protein